MKFLYIFLGIVLFVYFTSASNSQYIREMAKKSIDNLHKFLEEKNLKRNIFLVNFFKDDNNWHRGLFNPDSPGPAAVVSEVKQMFCIGPEPCMINFLHLNETDSVETYELYLTKEGFKDFPALTKIKLLIFILRKLAKLDPLPSSLEVYIDEICVCIQNFYELQVNESSVLKKEIRFTSIDELILNLSNACLRLSKGKSDRIKENLKNAVEGKAEVEVPKPDEKPNDSKKEKNSDDSKKDKASDGSEKEKNPDGTEKEEASDGSKEEKNPDGSKKVETPDGSKKVETPDDSKKGKGTGGNINPQTPSSVEKILKYVVLPLSLLAILVAIIVFIVLKRK
jgi:hypothetical protein